MPWFPAMRKPYEKPVTLQDWMRNASLVCLALAVVSGVLRYMIYAATSSPKIQDFKRDLRTKTPDNPPALMEPPPVPAEIAPVPAPADHAPATAAAPPAEPPPDVVALLRWRTAEARRGSQPEDRYAAYLLSAGLSSAEAARFRGLIRERESAGVPEDGEFDAALDESGLDDLRNRRQAACEEINRRLRALLGEQRYREFERFERGTGDEAPASRGAPPAEWTPGPAGVSPASPG